MAEQAPAGGVPEVVVQVAPPGEVVVQAEPLAGVEAVVTVVLGITAEVARVLVLGPLAPLAQAAAELLPSGGAVSVGLIALSFLGLGTGFYLLRLARKRM